MSSEADFHLGGYNNKQNHRIWGLENPKMIIEKPLYSQFLTVWCGFWARGIIRPYFYKNEAGAAVSVFGSLADPVERTVREYSDRSLTVF